MARAVTTNVTQQMIDMTRAFRWRVSAPRETRDRDRSLNGKARIKARKANHKEKI